MSDPIADLTILGATVRAPSKHLETFDAPLGIKLVEMTSDEVTSLCPVTGQPDWETVVIRYAPRNRCIESKSLKLYLWSFREEGAFCESLADTICRDIYLACNPSWCEVKVTQKARGGISITATAEQRRTTKE